MSVFCNAFPKAFINSSSCLFKTEVLYVKCKALNGIMEKIAIKRKTKNGLMQDTFNELWNRDELISVEEALDLIQ